MKIVSVTLANEAVSHVVRAAIDSLGGHVDKSILIHTDLKPSKKLTKAAKIGGGRHFPWCNDFAAARNYALDAAMESGADWAVMVDSDERFHWNGDKLRDVLAKATAPVGYVFHDNGEYAKPHLFKLPVKARYDGPVHEAIVCPEFFTLVNARVTETPKTEERVKAKHARDLGILAEQVKKHPTNPRWWYYLGQTLHSLERHEEAIVAYSRCASLRGWNEEAAWACYRAAECFCTLKRFDEAIETGATGLARHAGFGECAWIAGYANYWKGDMHQAVRWSEIAVQISGAYRAGRIVRIGFRDLGALYEKPWDVLYYALTALGDGAGAKDAEVQRDAFKRLREEQPNALSLPASKPARRERQLRTKHALTA